MTTNPLIIGSGTEDYPESEPLGRRIDVADTHVTGIVSGLLLTRESATTFGYSAGIGAFTDYAIPANSKKVSYTEGTGIPITITDAFGRIIVSLTDTGTVNQRISDNFNPEIYRTEIILGQLELDQTGQIRTDGAVPTSIAAISSASSFTDWLYSSGQWFLLEQGFIISPNGANVRLDLSAGIVFWPGVNLAVNVNDPNRKAYPELKPMPFNTVLQDGKVLGFGIFDVDTANYDFGGTLTPISPSSRWGYHIFFTDDGGEIWLSYGQNIEYNSREEIIAFFNAILEDHLFPPQYRPFSKIIGAVLFRANNTDFTDVSETVIYDRFYFGLTGGGGGGGGAQGTVKSVSDIFPDANGNVQLDIAQSQDDETKKLSFVMAPWATATTRNVHLPINGADDFALWSRKTDGTIYWLDGKVGIGTSTPDSSLMISSGNAGDVKLKIDAPSGQTAHIIDILKAAARYLALKTDGTFVINNAISIGSDVSPAANAIIEASGAGTQRIIVRNTTQADFEQVNVDYLTGNHGDPVSASNVIGQMRVRMTQAPPNPTKGEYTFLVNTGNATSPALWVSDQARVGIGGIAPVTSLDVSGDVRARGGFISVDANQKVHLNGAHSTTYLWFDGTNIELVKNGTVVATW